MMDKTDKLLRIVTASSLFDGHDAAINVFRRLFQNAGLEVIHIGHNRSVEEIAKTAIQEDAQAVCVSSYQGGHREFFRYLRQRLDVLGGERIGIFGGGGGTILPSEIAELQQEGVTRLYHSEDGRKIGLRGIVKDAISLMQQTDPGKEYYQTIKEKIVRQERLSDSELAKAISLMENPEASEEKQMIAEALASPLPVRPAILGFTGPGGAGKSSFIDEMVLRFLYATTTARVGILAFDPTKKKTGGALLGDRIRMNAIYNDRVFLRSMGTRYSGKEVSAACETALQVLMRGGFDLIFVETTGIGQADAVVAAISDLTAYVMTAEYGASTQLEKIEMLDAADAIVINKFDKLGAEAAYQDVLHAFAYARDLDPKALNGQELPVFPAVSSDFNHPGVTKAFGFFMRVLAEKKLLTDRLSQELNMERVKEHDNPHTFTIIPIERTFYLQEIANTIAAYREKTARLVEVASTLYKLTTLPQLQEDAQTARAVENIIGSLDPLTKQEVEELLARFHQQKKELEQGQYSYDVRGKRIVRTLFTTSLAGTIVRKIAVPAYRDWGDIVKFQRQENFPGFFPFTAGVFPLKSEEESPKRQFAGEGSPERTNRRFHYLADGEKAKRLSTAFDSVTLYGEDPDIRPDIYGKVGNSGVSVATLDDMLELYKGFDLTDPHTSVSLTINGPAPIILAMFFQAAIAFEAQKKVPRGEYDAISADVLARIRGTVQADILKEEQAQNTCIFSSKFAMKMMGDIEEYFINNSIRNFYSVSISGYHIAEAGANPITQLAFTLANGFTIVEYYLSRGMQIDDFAPNLSFFFSCGLDPEYAVIGRVARRIWAIALRDKYGAKESSLRLKYHMQTSGRSLHAQEIAFNDIRTTLQALIAILDNCNSLHTNAYDEAITTPTEESLRRAVAIQMIIEKECGLATCENVYQGSFFIEELTDLVEEAVLLEFEALSRRGGVLGAMEKQYQRHRIQTESLKYEMMKANGELPVVGVNLFVAEDAHTAYDSLPVVRATDEEKQQQIARTKAFIARAGKKNREALESLRNQALLGGNIFAELMETVKYCSLGQITQVLYECGGKFRRSM